MTAPTSPLAAWAGRFAAASAEPARFTIRELPFVTQIALRGDPAFPGFAQTLGTALPEQPNTWAGGRDCQVLWLGPDEWLATAGDAHREPLLAGLRGTLAGSHHAAVDVSANRTVIELRGADARAVLAKGCTLDLRAPAFRAPQCAQTLLARSQVLLQAVDERPEDQPAFRVFARISFSPYLADWLLDAAAETRASHGLDAERISIRLA